MIMEQINKIKEEGE